MNFHFLGYSNACLKEFHLGAEDIRGKHCHDVLSRLPGSLDPRDLEKVKNYDVVNTSVLKSITPKDQQAVLATLGNYWAIASRE
jgi:hypothetical protein